jgi:hypothetical protein
VAVGKDWGNTPRIRAGWPAESSQTTLNVVAPVIVSPVTTRMKPFTLPVPAALQAWMLTDTTVKLVTVNTLMSHCRSPVKFGKFVMVTSRGHQWCKA